MSRFDGPALKTGAGKSGVPNGIRTRVAAVKGRCPTSDCSLRREGNSTMCGRKRGGRAVLMGWFESLG